jgi:hypothetical protein
VRIQRFALLEIRLDIAETLELERLVVSEDEQEEEEEEEDPTIDDDEMDSNYGIILNVR